MPLGDPQALTRHPLQHALKPLYPLPGPACLPRPHEVYSVDGDTRRCISWVQGEALSAAGIKYQAQCHLPGPAVPKSVPSQPHHHTHFASGWGLLCLRKHEGETLSTIFLAFSAGCSCHYPDERKSRFGVDLDQYIYHAFAVMLAGLSVNRPKIMYLCCKMTSHNEIVIFHNL